jgi:hypothetical protein
MRNIISENSKDSKDEEGAQFTKKVYFDAKLHL